MKIKRKYKDMVMAILFTVMLIFFMTISFGIGVIMIPVISVFMLVFIIYIGLRGGYR